MKELNQKLLLYSIIELKECENYKIVNEYLQLGWTLISTHLNDFGHPIERHQKTIYCLGWNKDLGEPNHNLPGKDHYNRDDR